HCFSEFYRLRGEAGLPTEKSYGLKHAVVDNPNATTSQICQMLKTSPFPRFERQGLLELSEDDRYFVVNPALLEALTPAVRESLRRKAVGEGGGAFWGGGGSDRGDGEQEHWVGQAM